MNETMIPWIFRGLLFGILALLVLVAGCRYVLQVRRRAHLTSSRRDYVNRPEKSVKNPAARRWHAMNEKTLNNTTTVRGDQHFGGFILLECVDSRHWRAHDWSAFFARMVLSFGSCKSFLDNDGRAVTEFSEYKVMELSNRLEATGEHTPDRMVFAVPARLAISEQIYTRWKENLPAQPNPECNELQRTFRQ